VGRQEQIRRGKARTYSCGSRRFWALGDRMTAGGRIAEVCYNSTGRRAILVLLVEVQSLIALYFLAGDDRPDSRYRPPSTSVCIARDYDYIWQKEDYKRKLLCMWKQNQRI
jgi:hypothetical protein